MQRIIVLLLSFTLGFLASSQVLKGKIISTSGEPIPFASVYIHEITSGIVADEQGEFQTSLKPGTYTCEIRLIGYQSQTKKVDVLSSDVQLKVILTEKPVLLNELTVTPSKENPADRVMRHAIASAPFHLYQVSGFTSENYIKGSAKIEKVPGLMKMLIKDKMIQSLIGKLLVMESKNEITFQSPTKYTQKVVAYKSSIPKEIEPKGGFRVTPSNIYEERFMEKISPLSTQAFHYYQFKLDDIFTNGNYQVNKIRVVPKYKNEKLFSGFMYIIEDNWSLFSFDLTSTELGTTTRIKRNYQEIRPSLFMPITYDSYTSIGTMGVKGYARFYSSVKYTKIKVNELVKAIPSRNKDNVKIQTPSRNQQKRLERMEELSAKEKITVGEAIQLARLSKALAEPKEIKERKESLEILAADTVKLVIDSLASKRDSTFWETIRNVPLLAEEAQSFHHKDSLPDSKSIKTTNNSISISFGDHNKSTAWLNGGDFKVGKSAHVFYDGLIRGVLKEYNFVDGCWLGQKVTLSISTTKTNSLVISPAVYYTTARKSAVWSVNGRYNYAPLSTGLLKFDFGNTSEDIQGSEGTSRFLNSLSSLFLGDNVIRFYQKEYVNMENRIDLANGLRFTMGAGYEHQQILKNLTNYHFLGKTPRPNYPDQPYSDAFPVHSSSTGSLKLEYTPVYRYRIKDGKKEYVSSDYPTFGLNYKKAIPLLNEKEQSSYDKMEVSMDQHITLSEFDNLHYKVTAGKYLTSERLYATDFKYFTTSPLPVSNRPFDDSFNLMENYTSSTDRWLEMQLCWTSDYLVLKRIGFLQKYLFNEALQVHSLWDMQKGKPYLEAGYSIGFDDVGRIGIFSSFDGLKYKGWGVKVCIPLFSKYGKK